MDTTVLIDALRNRNGRRAWIADLVLAGREIFTSAICVAEVFGGICPGEEIATNRFLASLETVPVSAALATSAGLLQADLRRQGKTHSIADMIVAATAIEIEALLATDNQRDFQVNGLELIPLP